MAKMLRAGAALAYRRLLPSPGSSSPHQSLTRHLLRAPSYPASPSLLHPVDGIHTTADINHPHSAIASNNNCSLAIDPFVNLGRPDITGTGVAGVRRELDVLNDVRTVFGTDITAGTGWAGVRRVHAAKDAGGIWWLSSTESTGDAGFANMHGLGLDAAYGARSTKNVVGAKITAGEGWASVSRVHSAKDARRWLFSTASTGGAGLMDVHSLGLDAAHIARSTKSLLSATITSGTGCAGTHRISLHAATSTAAGLADVHCFGLDAANDVGRTKSVVSADIAGTVFAGVRNAGRTKSVDVSAGIAGTAFAGVRTVSLHATNNAGGIRCFFNTGTGLPGVRSLGLPTANDVGRIQRSFSTSTGGSAESSSDAVNSSKESVTNQGEEDSGGMNKEEEDSGGMNKEEEDAGGMKKRDQEDRGSMNNGEEARGGMNKEEEASGGMDKRDEDCGSNKGEEVRGGRNKEEEDPLDQCFSRKFLVDELSKTKDSLITSFEENKPESKKTTLRAVLILIVGNLIQLVFIGVTIFYVGMQSAIRYGLYINSLVEDEKLKEWGTQVLDHVAATALAGANPFPSWLKWLWPWKRSRKDDKTGLKLEKPASEDKSWLDWVLPWKWKRAWKDAKTGNKDQTNNTVMMKQRAARMRRKHDARLRENRILKF